LSGIDLGREFQGVGVYRKAEKKKPQGRAEPLRAGRLGCSRKRIYEGGKGVLGKKRWGELLQKKASRMYRDVRPYQLGVREKSAGGKNSSYRKEGK